MCAEHMELMEHMEHLEHLECMEHLEDMILGMIHRTDIIGIPLNISPSLEFNGRSYNQDEI